MTPGGLRADIQGLRGIAILLVLLYHAGWSTLPGGFVGVDVFFTVSGFLICELLRREHERSGRIDLARFFARRMKRLLPASLLMLVLVGAALHLLLPPGERAEYLSAARAAALYMANLWFALRAVDYLGGNADLNPFLHMWSLGVEEQFYVAIPLLYWLITCCASAASGQVRIARLLILVTLLSFVGCVWMTQQSQPWAFFGTPWRAWQFGIGGLVAYAAPRLLLGQQSRLLLGVAGLLAVGWAAIHLRSSDAFPGLLALLPALGTAALLASLPVSSGVAPIWAPERWLAATPLRWLGDVSYSLYLWHWPVLVLLRVEVPQPSAMHVAGAVLMSVMLAALSTYWVENPVRRSIRFEGTNRATVLIGLGASILVALGLSAVVMWNKGLAAADPSTSQLRREDRLSIYRNGCHVDFDPTEPRGHCRFGAAESSRSIVLIGDSHAAHWFPALEALAREQGYGLVSWTKSACPAFDAVVDNVRLRRRYVECEQWRAAVMARLRELQPALVVISNATGGYFSDRLVTQDAWRQGVERTLGELSQMGIRTAIIAATPWLDFEPPRCHQRSQWRHGGQHPDACRYRLEAALNAGEKGSGAEREVVSGMRGATWIDVSEAVCAGKGGDCATIIDGGLLFRDSNHLTAQHVRRLTPELGHRLADSLR